MDGKGCKNPQKVGIQSEKIGKILRFHTLQPELGFSLLELFYDLCLLHGVGKGMTRGNQWWSMIILMIISWEFMLINTVRLPDATATWSYIAILPCSFTVENLSLTEQGNEFLTIPGLPAVRSAWSERPQPGRSQERFEIQLGDPSYVEFLINFP